MGFWTYANLAEVTGGRWLIEPSDLGAEVTGLWHDTREIHQGQAYLAIKGEHFDGHAFVDKAFEAGAALAIVQTHPPSLERGAGGRVANHPVLLVEDTIKALQDLARAYRDELAAGGCKVIGIAGSNGKTTTRHLIHHVLTHAGLNGTQSPKSFNNHLGVPLTLLSAKPEHDFVACEIGTNHPGEIDFLSAIARPDIAVITSIGEEHLEFFGNLERVAREEASILQHVLVDGIAMVHEDAWEMIKPLLGEGVAPSIETYGLGGQGPGMRITPIHAERSTGIVGSFRVRYLHDEATGSLPIPGVYNLLNAGAAIRVGLFLGIDLDTLVSKLSNVRPADSRGKIYRFGSGVVVIDDAYNANPTSMRAALDMLFHSADDEQRRVAVLGDMFELGDASAAAHHAVAHYAVTGLMGPVILIGESFSRVEIDPDYAHQSHSMQWTNRTPGNVTDLLQPGDTVLLKASRGMALERLIPAIERRFGPAKDDQPT